MNRHKESKQANNNMQTSCQAIGFSVAKLSTNMSRSNKTCSARQPHQVVQISLGHFELDMPVRPIISYWMLSSWKLHDMTYQRFAPSASPMTMLSLLMEKNPLKLLKNILEHYVLLLYNQYTDTSAKKPLTASFVFTYSTNFFCITCLLLLPNALDIQDSS